MINERPELYHYTTFAGLNGIVTTNNIWATRFADLNDRSEMLSMKKPLTCAVAAASTSYFFHFAKQAGLKRFSRKDQATLNEVHHEAFEYAQIVIDDMFEKPFGADQELDFAIPFIASFCSHTTDQHYERRHGLLSQWRGYGHDQGGYCIVFDTKALSALLRKEMMDRDYIFMKLAPVQYGDEYEYETVMRTFPTLVQELAEMFVATISHDWSYKRRHDFYEIMLGAAKSKNRGFFEEREVRIIACPTSDQVRATLEATLGRPRTPRVPVHTTEGLHGTRYHIWLFENMAIELPIKRIIIGPSAQQDENLSRAKRLFSSNIPISLSEIPFTRG